MSARTLKSIVAAFLLTEGMVDTNCTKLNKLQAFALDLGGTNFQSAEGACYVELNSPEAAQEFMIALDVDDAVEGYDVTTDGEVVEAESLLGYPADTVFGFDIYLAADAISYESEEFDEVAESIEVVTEGFVERIEKLIGGDIKMGRNSIAGLPFDITEGESDYIALTAVDADAANDLANKLKAAKFKVTRHGKVDMIVEALLLAEGTMVDELGVVLDEVAKKITVNSHGTKRIKMQCAKGFKWSAADKACVKIAGAELATRRKASIHAVASRKAGGQSLKNRVAVKTKKAMHFRKSMGIK